MRFHIAAIGVAVELTAKTTLLLDEELWRYVSIETEANGALHLTPSAPVALVLAHGYEPSDLHFDVGNGPAWLRKSREALKVDLDVLFTDTGCAPGVAKCLEAGDMACGGTPPPVDSLVESGQLDTLGLAQVQSSESATCPRYVGKCTEHGGCNPDYGPAECQINLPDNNSTKDGAKNQPTRLSLAISGECLCRPGTCEVAGRCVSTAILEPRCYKFSGRTCPNFACDRKHGIAMCEEGLCVCAPGFCSIGGTCIRCPGGEGAKCDKEQQQQNSSQFLRRLTPAEDSFNEGRKFASNCCATIERARDDLSSFARCAARAQAKREAETQKLDWGEPGSQWDTGLTLGATTPTLSVGEAHRRVMVGIRGHGEVELVVRLIRGSTVFSPGGVMRTLDSTIDSGDLHSVEVRALSAPYRLPLPSKHGEPEPILLHVMSDSAADLSVLGLPLGSHVLSTSSLSPRSLFDFRHRAWEPIDSFGGYTADESQDGVASLWHAPVGERTAWMLAIPPLREEALPSHAVFQVGTPPEGPPTNMLQAYGFIVACVGVLSLLVTFGDISNNVSEFFRPETLGDDTDTERTIMLPMRHDRRGSPMNGPTHAGGFTRVSVVEEEEWTASPVLEDDEDEEEMFSSRSAVGPHSVRCHASLTERMVQAQHAEEAGEAVGWTSRVAAAQKAQDAFYATGRWTERSRGQRPIRTRPIHAAIPPRRKPKKADVYDLNPDEPLGLGLSLALGRGRLGRRAASGSARCSESLESLSTRAPTEAMTERVSGRGSGRVSGRASQINSTREAMTERLSGRPSWEDDLSDGRGLGLME